MPNPVISYPAIRYHETHIHVQVADPDDEITKCGEICDTQTHHANKSGWRDRPYANYTKPKPAPVAATPNNLADLLIFTEKMQRKINGMEVTMREMNEALSGLAFQTNAIAELGERIASVEDAVTAKPSGNKR